MLTRLFLLSVNWADFLNQSRLLDTFFSAGLKKKIGAVKLFSNDRLFPSKQTITDMAIKPLKYD